MSCRQAASARLDHGHFERTAVGGRMDDRIVGPVEAERGDLEMIGFHEARADQAGHQHGGMWQDIDRCLNHGVLRG